jgi:hypothetical protein
MQLLKELIRSYKMSTFEEELREKLADAEQALELVNGEVKNLLCKQEILQKRTSDIKLALSALVNDSPFF